MTYTEPITTANTIESTIVVPPVPVTDWHNIPLPNIVLGAVILIGAIVAIASAIFPSFSGECRNCQSKTEWCSINDCDVRSLEEGKPHE